MDIKEIRKDFPLLVNYPNLAYLDNAATTHKPNAVLDAIADFYKHNNANPLRGLYPLSQRATDAYEDARESVRAFLHARSTEEIIFTRNASESLNLIAYSYGNLLQEGDEIVITVMEHHSNLIPWQQLAKRKNLTLKWIECDETGAFTEETFRSVVGPKTRLVAMTLVSNVLGRENDVKKYAKIAHENGAVFVCDGAQGVPHLSVDVVDLNVDFLVFSGHKMIGPMGIGAVYAKKELLDKMPPFLFGGEMIEYVTREDSTWAELPHKFEAGTVNAADAVGLKAAIEYYGQIGFDNIVEREKQLGRLAFEIMKDVPYLHIIGAPDADDHHGIFSFTVEGVHPHDIAEILSADDVCVRAGHHCAQVLLQHLKQPATARVSLAFYNTEDEIIKLGESLKSLRRRMGYGV